MSDPEPSPNTPTAQPTDEDEIQDGPRVSEALRAESPAGQQPSLAEPDEDLEMEGPGEETPLAEPSSGETGQREVPAAAGISDLMEQMDSLTRLVETASAANQAFHQRALYYEDTIRRLQQKVEALQSDQIQELLKPVLSRLASMLTQATEAEALAREAGGSFSAQVEFEHFVDVIVEALALIGIESVQAGPSVAFDRALHAARKAVPTDDQALDNTITRVLRQGLIRTGAERAFLPAQVFVYRFVRPEALVESNGPASLPDLHQPPQPAQDQPSPSGEASLGPKEGE